MRWVLLYTRGLIVDQHLRRLTMFYVVIAAMLMAFAGDMFFAGWLREKLVRFVVYWLVCGWLTILAALLAVYDLILLRVQHPAPGTSTAREDARTGERGRKQITVRRCSAPPLSS